MNKSKTVDATPQTYQFNPTSISTQIIAVIVLLLSQVLPYIGITIDSQELERAIQAIVALVAGVWVWIQNRKLHNAIAVGGSSQTLGIKA